MWLLDEMAWLVCVITVRGLVKIWDFVLWNSTCQPKLELEDVLVATMVDVIFINVLSKYN